MKNKLKINEFFKKIILKKSWWGQFERRGFEQRVIIRVSRIRQKVFVPKKKMPVQLARPSLSRTWQQCPWVK